MARKRLPSPLLAFCPSCGEAEGSPCTTPSGKPTKPHAKRQKAATRDHKVAALFPVQAPSVALDEELSAQAEDEAEVVDWAQLEEDALRPSKVAQAAEADRIERRQAVEGSPCESCSAPRGRECLTPSGKEAHRLHKARREAHKAAQVAKRAEGERQAAEAVPAAERRAARKAGEAEAAEGLAAHRASMRARNEAERAPAVVAQLAVQDAAQVVQAAQLVQDEAARHDRKPALSLKHVGLEVADGERVALIGCSSRKAKSAGPARQLYTGQLFKAAMAYAEAEGLRPLIVSGLHGLIAPTTIVEPYDYSLADQKKAERERVQGKIAGQLVQALEGKDIELVSLLGNVYHQAVTEADLEHDRPMVGMDLFAQRAWLKEQVETIAALAAEPEAGPIVCRQLEAAEVAEVNAEFAKPFLSPTPPAELAAELAAGWKADDAARELAELRAELREAKAAASNWEKRHQLREEARAELAELVEAARRERDELRAELVECRQAAKAVSATAGRLRRERSEARTEAAELREELAAAKAEAAEDMRKVRVAAQAVREARRAERAELVTPTPAEVAVVAQVVAEPEPGAELADVLQAATAELEASAARRELLTQIEAKEAELAAARAARALELAAEVKAAREAFDASLRRKGA